MRHLRNWAALVAFASLAFVASCVSETPPQPPPSPDVLMQADRDFAADVAADGVDAWVEWFGETGKQIVPRRVLEGPEDIRAFMEPGFASEGFSLEWDPEHAEIAASGDLGFTYGRYLLRGVGPEGEPAVSEGRYVTIWRKTPDGTWRVALDTGVPDPPPAPAE